MRSRIFDSNDYLLIQEQVQELINTSPDFLSTNTAQSPRAAGDAIKTIVAASFDKILGEHCGEYSTNFAHRAMADLAFKDPEGLYYIVDVKTHRTDTKFNMPNLTSVERWMGPDSDRKLKSCNRKSGLFVKAVDARFLRRYARVLSQRNHKDW